MNLEGAAALLTGASRGLGVVIAESLAREGADIVLAARSAEELDEVAERVRAFRVRAIPVPTDLSDPSALEDLAARATAELGRVDVLVNNAGIERYAEFATYDRETIERIVRVNLLAPIELTRAVVPQMIERRKGHVVNVASVAGKTAVPYNVIYSSTKHGLVGFSWSLREELKPAGVGVSVVCPGFVSDAGMFADWSQGESPPGLASTVSPQDVADAVVRAVERDVPEIIVAKGPMKVIDVLHALSPSLTTSISRRTGAYGFLKKATTRDQRL